ncbi:MAG: AMP-binding protein, partial [Candidatus Dormibacteraceae bacterium]
MRPSIAERRAALATAYPAWEPATFTTHLRRTVARFGDRPAVITDARTLTYDDLLGAARAVARGLVKLGVQPGDHVAMVVANQPEFVVLQYAVAFAGAVCVPFNFRLREEELGYVLEQSNAVCLITMDRLGNSDYLAMLDHLAPGWVTHPEGGFPRLRQVVTFATDPGAERRPGALDWAGLVRLGEDVEDREIDRRSELRKPLDVACVMYT